MAISFSRPDPSSPASVGSASFTPSRRGFDQAEVREFLRMVAAELARLQERERFLESELKAAQTNGLSAPGRLDEHTLIALLGEETARVLASAREASAQIRDRAEESATRMVKEASEDAMRIRQAAEVEAQRLRDDASGDAQGEVELAKQQGREMVEEARVYREKVLAELSRRRDAARLQIEQLMHGRDRLLAAFDRARGASEEVIKDLVAVEEDPEILIGLPTHVAPPTTEHSAPISDIARTHEDASELVPSGTVSSEHPSVSIFDHEVEDNKGSATSSRPISTSHPEPTTGIFDIAAEEEVEIKPINDVVEDDVVDVDSDIEAEHDIDAPISLGVTTNSNTASQTAENDFVAPVVSIFGGRRRPPILEPEVERELEDEAEIDHPLIDDAVIDQPDIDVPEIDEAHADLAATEERVSPGKQAIDDIFARLRASAPATVADEVNATPKKPTAKVEKSQPAEVLSRPIPVTPVVEPARFVDRDEALSPIFEMISKKMKRVLADELNEILEHVNGKKPKLECDAMVSTFDVHVDRYVASISEEILSAATEGAKSMKSARGSVKRVDPMKIELSVRDMVADTIVSPLRARLEQVLRDCDGNTDDIADGVRAIYREWKMSRIDAHSADIACVAHSRGAFLSLEEGTRVCWMVDPNGPACADAEDNSLAGAVTCGEKFPTGHEYPLAHPGCRCLVCPMPQ